MPLPLKTLPSHTSHIWKYDLTMKWTCYKPANATCSGTWYETNHSSSTTSCLTPPACRRGWPAHQQQRSHSLYLFYEIVLWLPSPRGLAHGGRDGGAPKRHRGQAKALGTSPPRPPTTGGEAQEDMMTSFNVYISEGKWRRTNWVLRFYVITGGKQPPFKMMFIVY